MKIVLVAQNSSYTHTNAAVRILKKHLCVRHDVKITETTVNDRGGVLSLTQKLYAEKADMYAFSVYIWNRYQQFEAACALKKLLPESLMLFGGPEVSFEDGDFFEKYPFADYLIKGEGEEAICDAADGKYAPKTIIDGGIFGGFENSEEPYFSDGAEDVSADGKLIYYESSRGCPYNCSYCLSSVKKHGEKLRLKPVDAVKKEIAVIMAHNVRAVKFVDRTFNADKERTKELFRYFTQLAEKYIENGKYKGPALHFEICAALLDDVTVEILSAAPQGLFQFEIGVQTVTPQTLLAIGRNDDTAKILANVKKLREKTNVTVHLDLICGLPLDTYSGIAKAFDAIYGLCDCIQVGMLKILPGTKMRADCEKYGIKYLDVPPYTILENSTASFDDLRKLAAIGECAERFCEKDNPWYSSIKYMVSLCPSPFGFFEELCSYLENPGAIPSVKMYSALYAYARDKMNLGAEQLSMLCEYIRYDYLVSQQGNVPAEFQRIYTESETARLSDIKQKIIHSFPKGQCPYFIPATEIHFFGFDASHAYVIDRKNRTAEKT